MEFSRGFNYEQLRQQSIEDQQREADKRATFCPARADGVHDWSVEFVETAHPEELCVACEARPMKGEER